MIQGSTSDFIPPIVKEGNELWRIKLILEQFIWRKVGRYKVVNLRIADTATRTWIRIPRKDRLDVTATDGFFYMFVRSRELDLGQIRLNSEQFIWKKPKSYKVVNLRKDDISSMTWIRVPRRHRLDVRTRDGLLYKFAGFRELDVTRLTSFIQSHYHITLEEEQISLSGHNWGDVEFKGKMLGFSVDSKNAFEVCLTDVAQTQLHGKTDVHLEFHEGDTTGANENDSLLDLSFHIPDSNTQFNGDDDRTPAQVFHDKILCMIEVESNKGPVVTFEQVRFLTPRGRYAIELCISFLHLQGFANAFKIQYSNIHRIFVLPKYNQPHTCVAISLDPPLQRGQTLYPYIVLQFETEMVVDKKLTISEELWADKYKDRLEASYKGLIFEVFTLILRGLSGAKVSRAKGYHSNHDGYAIKATLKAEEGLVYPLEKGFFFLGKAPTFILYKEIEYVVFQRDDGGSAMLRYFDLLVKHGYDQQHQFRNIRRTEYHKVHNFMSWKGLRILNHGVVNATSHGVDVLEDNDDHDDVDFIQPLTLRRMRRLNIVEESDENKESVATEHGNGSVCKGKEIIATNNSKNDGSASKESSTSSSTKVRGETSSNKSRKKKSKDRNAPKSAMSAFMFFSNYERENLKRSNPELSFKDVGRVLQMRWDRMTEEEKESYEAIAQSDANKRRDK